MFRPVCSSFSMLFLMVFCCGLCSAPAFGTEGVVQIASGAVYDKYLSSQAKVLPFVQRSAKIDGLFNLVDAINGQVDTLSHNGLVGEARDRELAQLFVNLVQATMMMNVDPFPATELEPYLKRGIEYCLDQIAVPDLPLTMAMVMKTFAELPSSGAPVD